MKSISEQFRKGSKPHAENWEGQIFAMKQLKKFSQDCSKANINMQPLIRLLSTICVELAVTKGYAAMLNGKILSTPIVMNRSMMLIQSNETLDLVWTIEAMLGDLLEWLGTGKEQS